MPKVALGDVQCRPNQQEDGACRAVEHMKDEPRPDEPKLAIPQAKDEEEKSKEFQKEMTKDGIVLAAKSKAELGQLTNKLDNLI